MTKDQLTEKFIDLNERNIKAFDGLSEAIRDINGNNVLHNAQTEKIEKQIERLVTGAELISNGMTKIIWVIVLALIVLAGAEKVLKFI